jgi:putative transposase
MPELVLEAKMKQQNSYKEYYPPHIYQDETIYFITARTIDRIKFFNTKIKKEILVKCLAETIINYKIKIYAYVILSNHYHLLIKIQNKFWLPKFIKSFHGKSAILINKTENISARKIWINYFDRCIRSKKDFWTRFNYIHNNPIKHGYIKNPESLNQYRFSSYNQWIKKNGAEWMASCFTQYPVIDFTCENDLD